MKVNTNTLDAKVITINTQTLADLKNSVLIVSVFVNLTVLTTWLVLQLSA